MNWSKYKSLLVIRHPMQRIESLYSNKFTNKKLLKTTFKQNPFEIVTRKIILSRKYNPGAQFKNSLTPNELVSFVLTDLQRNGEHANGHWAPIWRVCPVCLLNFTVYARLENMKEDEKYYKTISKLNLSDMSDKDDHGNASPRKFTSKEFWSQVERSKIYKLAAQFAYK